MSNLSINVQVGATPPSSSTVAGTSLTVQAWKASLFIRNPARNNGVPAGSADSTQTTDGSGNATFTGLSSVDYWILVIDARGVTNWFPCPAARVGGVDPFVCTIPWSTPVSVTSPADDRGGDTIGGRTNQGLWAPRTHIHQIPASGASAHGEEVAHLTYVSSGYSIGATSTVQFNTAVYDPLSGFVTNQWNVPSALNGLNLYVVVRIDLTLSSGTGYGNAHIDKNNTIAQFPMFWVTIVTGGSPFSVYLHGTLENVATADAVSVIISTGTSGMGINGNGGSEMWIFAC